MVRDVFDFVFLMDASSSMEKHLNVVRKSTLSFFSQLSVRQDIYPPVRDWRAKIVGFRDYAMDGPENWLIDHPFTRDISELERQFSSIKGNGRDNSPGSLIDALYQIATMGETDPQQEPDPLRWRHKREASHIVILLTDVSTPNRLEPFLTSLARPSLEAAGLDVSAICDKVFDEIERERIILHIVAPEAECYNELACVPRAEYVVTEGNALEATISDPRFWGRIMQQFSVS